MELKKTFLESSKTTFKSGLKIILLITIWIVVMLYSRGDKPLQEASSDNKFGKTKREKSKVDFRTTESPVKWKGQESFRIFMLSRRWITYGI